MRLGDAAGVRPTEYVLDGEMLDGLGEAVTQEEVAGGTGAADFVARLVAEKAAVRAQGFDPNPEVREDGTRDVAETGGRVSTVSIHAGPNYDRSERSAVVLLRVIEGDGRLFAVQRARAASPPWEVLDTWTALRPCDGGTCR